MPKSTSRTQRVQQSTPPRPVSVTLSHVPWAALKPDIPELNGYHFTGETPEKALINARAFLSKWGKDNNLNITIKEVE